MNDISLLIIILLAVGFLLRVDFVFYIAYVCIGVYAWSHWVTPRALNRLRLERDYRDHAFLGEQVPVRLTLTNAWRLPLPWLQLRETVPLGLQTGDPVDHALTLRGRESTAFTYHVQAMRRGYYQVGPLTVRLGDLFGFVERTGKFAPNYLTVYPRITPLTRLGLPSRLPFGTLPSRQRLFEDPARPMGVREFRSGDSLRQINWKVSARNPGALQVKTFEPAISLETTILLNMNLDDYAADRYHAPEWAVEVAASLAAHLVKQRQAVGLLTNGADPLASDELAFDEESGRLLSQRDGRASSPSALPPPIPPRPGRAHLMKVLEILARIEAAPTADFLSWAPRACLSLSWGVTILAITPRGDQATCEMLHRLLRAGFNPLLIVVLPEGNFGTVRERARRLGFRAFAVAEPPDLDVWRRPARTVG